MNSRLYIGADHAGWEYKEALKTHLTAQGFEMIDLGNDHMDENDDYPDFSYPVAQKVATDPLARGILLCGNAQGVCIVANKVRGVRAVTGFDEKVAVTSRTDDDSNILCLPARHLTEEQALHITDIWLQTAFGHDERHVRRLQKLADIESKHV
jgi:ribose 5-phosphate isomerase B